MKTETVTCDVCGKIKAKVNHWYKVRSSETVLSIHTSDVGVRGQDACGQECVHKLLDKFLRGDQ